MFYRNLVCGRSSHPEIPRRPSAEGLVSE